MKGRTLLYECFKKTFDYKGYKDILEDIWYGIKGFIFLIIDNIFRILNFLTFGIFSAIIYHKSFKARLMVENIENKKNIDEDTLKNLEFERNDTQTKQALLDQRDLKED